MERLVIRKESLNALDEYSFISQKYCRFYEYKQSEPKRKLRTYKNPSPNPKYHHSSSLKALDHSNHSPPPPELSVPFCPLGPARLVDLARFVDQDRSVQARLPSEVKAEVTRFLPGKSLRTLNSQTLAFKKKRQIWMFN